ncbi:MAG: lipoate-protein ligase A [Candidatus Promineifilaceae bacterium]|jgi:lipoate-protein ligase A
MKFVDNQNQTDPRTNLAVEEFLLREVTDEPELLLFYINEPAVIIGRNQNSIEEIDPEYIETNGVHVVRRLSGGGAVYHDFGNLNFSYISGSAGNLHNYEHFIQPVINVLNNLGVPAELKGKSDVFVDGKKISGNAQYASRGRMVSHGTILFDTNIQHMMQSLNPRQTKIESPAVQSVRNFVTNVKDHLDAEFTIEMLRQKIIEGVFETSTPPQYQLTPADWAKIDTIRSQRFGTWDWNIGRSPQFNIQRTEVFPAGKLDVRINVKKGIIDDIRFFGTYTFSKEIDELQNHLIGKRYETKSIEDALENINLSEYFGGIPTIDIRNLLY